MFLSNLESGSIVRLIAENIALSIELIHSLQPRFGLLTSLCHQRLVLLVAEMLTRG
jgi:hypothetical protein